MDGKFLDSAAVRSLEKMPTKLQLLTSVAIAIKKVSVWAHIVTLYARFTRNHCPHLGQQLSLFAVAPCQASLHISSKYLGSLLFAT